MNENQMNDEIPPKYYNDDKTKLICQYCLAEMKMLTSSHLKFHDMTIAEYKEKFPDAPLSMKKYKKIEKKKSVVSEERNNISLSGKTSIGLANNTQPVKVSIKTTIDHIKKKQDADIPIDKQTELSDDQKILTKDRIFKAVQRVYPNIKRNHIFKKTNVSGNILYTVMTDFGDPSKRVMIDFSGMAWHMKTPLLTKYRKKDLLSESKWKYIHIEEYSLTTNEIIEILKSK